MERSLKLLLIASLAIISNQIYSQEKAEFEVYGFTQLDYVQDYKRSNPVWQDTLRPSRISTNENEYGSDGQATLSVRQSRFGVKGSNPIGGDKLETKFEFDLFGVGADEGQTTMRVRHAFGKWGNWLAGQTHSLYMDIDMFPNTIDYWGPNGIVFLRTPQIRYIFSEGSNFFAVGIEKPSSDVDPGDLRELGVEEDSVNNLQPDNKLPDITARFRINRDWGHFHVGAILRRIGYDSANQEDGEPKGSETGYGVQLATKILTGSRNYLLASTNFGQGIASYQNDGGTDLAPSGSGATDVRAELVPLGALSLYYNHFWSDLYSSALGYARVEVDNRSLQSDDAFKAADYASVNLLHTPNEKIMVGFEVLWGSKRDKADNYGDDIRSQLSFKYSFSSLD